MIKAVLYIAAILAVATGQTTQVNQCTWEKDAPLPLNAYLLGCDRPPCQLPQLQNAIIGMVFKAPRNIKSMRTKADVSLSVGIFNTPPFTYGLKEQAITCNFLKNSYCPLQKGEVVHYELAMYIEPYFTVGVSATAEFQILDEETSTSVACIRVPFTIVAAVNPQTKKTNDFHDIEERPVLLLYSMAKRYPKMIMRSISACISTDDSRGRSIFGQRENNSMQNCVICTGL